MTNEMVAPVAWVLQRISEGHPNFAPGDFSWMDIHESKDSAPPDDANWRAVPLYLHPQPAQGGQGQQDERIRYLGLLWLHGAYQYRNDDKAVDEISDELDSMRVGHKYTADYVDGAKHLASCVAEWPKDESAQSQTPPKEQGQQEDWIAFSERWPDESAAKDDPSVKTRNRVLVTNNIGARDRMGRMSHVWLLAPIQSREGKEVVGFTDGDRKVHGLTHWKYAHD